MTLQAAQCSNPYWRWIGPDTFSQNITEDGTLLQKYCASYDPFIREEYLSTNCLSPEQNSFSIQVKGFQSTCIGIRGIYNYLGTEKEIEYHCTGQIYKYFAQDHEGKKLLKLADDFYTNDIITFAYDYQTKKITISKNNAIPLELEFTYGTARAYACLSKTCYNKYTYPQLALKFINSEESELSTRLEEMDIADTIYL